MRRRVTLKNRVLCALSRRWLEAGDAATLYVCAPVVSDHVSVMNAVETADGRAHRITDTRNAVLVFFVADADAVNHGKKRAPEPEPEPEPEPAPADEATPSARLAAAVRALYEEQMRADVVLPTVPLAAEALAAEPGDEWRNAPDKVLVAVSIALCATAMHSNNAKKTLGHSSHVLSRWSCMLLHQPDEMRAAYATDPATVLAHLVRGYDAQNMQCVSKSHSVALRYTEVFVARAKRFLDDFLAPPRGDALIRFLRSNEAVRPVLVSVASALF